jgi:hypothetical protein
MTGNVVAHLAERGGEILAQQPVLVAQHEVLEGSNIAAATACTSDRPER